MEEARLHVSGIPWKRPKVRVDRMIEHTKILQALFTREAPVTLQASSTASTICRDRRYLTRPAVPLHHRWCHPRVCASPGRSPTSSV